MIRGPNMNRALVLIFLIASIGANVFFFASTGRSNQTSPDLVPASSCGKGLAGKVEVNRVRMSDGEQILQVIDHEREVICYGKTAPAGASTISCQKYIEKK